MFLQNTQSLDETLLILKHFHQCAGLRLNKDKSEAIILGLNNNIDLTNYGITSVQTSIKSLGIIIKKDVNNIAELNFNDRLIKVRNLLNMWKCRQLSIKGKITILRSQALPIILYPASVLYTPEHIIDKIDKLFFNFIWPNKKHHVKKNILIQNIEDGGLKMPHVKSMMKAIKLMWIKRLLTKSNNFTLMAHTNSKIENFEEFFNHKITPVYLSSQPTDFYRQILEFWDEVRTPWPLLKININEILNEKLWLNKNILIDNKLIYKTEWINSGINTLHDILKNDNSFKTQAELHTEFQLNIDIMELNQIVSAIPKEWKTLLRSQTVNDKPFTLQEDLSMKIGNRYKKITKVLCKEFYWQLVNKVCHRPTAIEKWEELYYYITFDWKHIFSIPYLTASETSLQSIQFQIINRYYPCRSIVNTWYNEEDKKCAICDCDDTLEHYFYECLNVKQFWASLLRWWNNKSQCNFKLGCLDILFGIMNENNENVVSVLNYCILYAKKYISTCKLANHSCNFQNFVCKLKKMVLIKEYIAEINGSLDEFVLKWHFILN